MKKWILIALSTILFIFLILGFIKSDGSSVKNVMVNNLKEEYEILYSVHSGFPDSSVNIEIYKSNKKIAEYSTQYDDRHMPQEIVFLFEYEEDEYYYIGTDEANFINVFRSGQAEQIGLEYEQLRLREDYSALSENMKSEYHEISKILQINFTETEIKGIFDKCSYDDEEIMKIYYLSS